MVFGIIAMVNLMLERAHEDELQSVPIRKPYVRVTKVGAQSEEDEAKQIHSYKREFLNLMMR